MKNVIITVVGKDQPGLVDTISTHVLALKGNWLTSNLSKMAGQFAGIIQVALPAENVAKLQHKLTSIPQLQCVVKLDEEQASEAETSYLTIDVMGNDKPGIVQEITSSLAAANASVVKMQTSCEAAPNWGGELFKAHITVATCKTVDVDEIAQRLEAIANDLVVELQLEKQ